MDLTKNPPPPAKKSKKSGTYLAIMEQLKTDKSLLQDAENARHASALHDRGAPSTRAKRQRVREDYESFVKSAFDKEVIEDIWNIDTFYQYCHDFLYVYLQICIKDRHGRLSDAIQANVLVKLKEALYWWAVRLIPKFDTILSSWHAQLLGHIDFLARQFNLHGGHRTKNNLGTQELRLFFLQLNKFQRQVENWKQHYLAWLLTYITAVRPGSITVSSGYEAGADLGSGLVRQEDETLRWSDIEFERRDDTEGIAVKVHYKYIKNERNPHTGGLIPADKRFTFLPHNSNFELDLSAILLSIAFSRGLFPQYKSLTTLHTGDERFLQKDPQVNKQAVLVAANQNSGDLQPTVPMKFAALNSRLQEMCVQVGIMSYHTMYSFRRSAIVETRRKEGTEMAKNLAGHTQRSETITTYDNFHMSDLDITAMRLGMEQIPRDELRAMMSAASMRDPTDGNSTRKSVKQRLEENIDIAMLEDQRHVDMEQELNTLLVSLATMLGIEPMSTRAKDLTEYKRLLQKRNLRSAIDQLDQMLYKRRLLRKAMRKTLKHKILKDMFEEHKTTLKVTKQAITRPTGPHMQPEGTVTALAAASAVAQQIDAANELDRVELEALRRELDMEESGTGAPDKEDVGIDEKAVGQAQEVAKEGSHDEPEAWADLGDHIIVRVDDDEPDDDDPVVTRSDRLTAIIAFTMMSSTPNADLACILCQLDPSMPPAVKARRYTKHMLDKHLKVMSGPLSHRPIAGARRAMENEGDPFQRCHLCGLEGITLAHFERVHGVDIL